eukprot:gene13426-13554_t
MGARGDAVAKSGKPRGKTHVLDTLQYMLELIPKQHDSKSNSKSVDLDQVYRGADDPGGAANRWAPAGKWASEFKDEWVFRYTVLGKKNVLALHCSLQRGSGRMLVHAVEVNNDPNAARNSQLLGLQLERYVPDDQKLRDKTWAGVVQNEFTLEQMLQCHVVVPLLEAAEELPTGSLAAELPQWTEGEAAGSTSAWLSWFSDPWGQGQGKTSSHVAPAVLITAAVALAVVAAYVVTKRRRL